LREVIKTKKKTSQASWYHGPCSNRAPPELRLKRVSDWAILFGKLCYVYSTATGPFNTYTPILFD